MGKEEGRGREEFMLTESFSYCPQVVCSLEGTYSHFCERHLLVVSKLRENNFIDFFFKFFGWAARLAGF